jgi:hypothetical protein
MWVINDPVTGEKIEMEDVSRLFMFFPLFHIDFTILHESGVIKRIAFDQYEWTKSTVSLSEYFRWIGSDISIPGGLWAPVEKVFKINRRTLTKSASRNNDFYHKKESKDFKRIKNLVEQYREKVIEAFRQEEDNLDYYNYRLLRLLLQITK